MTEVPEYLLERSRARRAALGLGGGAPAPAAATAGDAPSPAAGEAAPAAPADASAAAAGPGPAAPAGPPAEVLPTYVAEPGPKSGIPVWMMPVLLMLPLWAIVYMGAFGQKAATGPLTPIQLGAQVFTKAGCSGCHGATGGGGVGPALAKGEAKITFPDEAAHIEWVQNGSVNRKGQPYGDPKRAGGQRVAKVGGMPAFKGQLTEAEIKAVVTYEREGL